MSKSEFTLSIETAVEGGSISLLREDTEIDYWIGTREVSRAEDILVEIRRLLEKNDLERKCIKKIVVSRGPGSYTGVRIGIAVGCGLKKALDCRLIGISVFRGMLLADTKKTIDCKQEILIAVPFGNNQICRQNFRDIRQGNYEDLMHPQISKIDDFLNSFDSSKFQQEKRVILHRKLYSNFGEHISNRINGNGVLIDAGENIAAFIGAVKAVKDEYGGLRPIYIRDDALFSRQ